MLSGHSLSEEIEPYRSRGYDFAILSKPMHPSDLLKAIEAERVVPNNCRERLRVLNVDDVEEHRYSLSRLFAHAGFEVSEAATGTDALRIAIQSKPALASWFGKDEQEQSHSGGKIMTTRRPLPPFIRESAIEKVRLAEDAWNTRDPEKVSLGYSIDSRWRNPAEFVNGREEIVAFLPRKWSREQIARHRIRQESCRSN